MKLNFFFPVTIFCLFSLNLHAQEIPDDVRNAFQADYENAEEVQWTDEGTGKYQVEFTQNSRSYEVSYDDQGNKIAEKKTIQEIPDKVKAALEESYPAYKRKKAALVTTSKAPPFYEVLLAKGEKELSVRLDQEGRVLD